MHAWKSGVKTTYYLRSRPRTRINQTNAGDAGANGPGGGGPTTAATSTKQFTDAEALACSLENPETCEACD